MKIKRMMWATALRIDHVWCSACKADGERFNGWTYVPCKKCKGKAYHKR